MQRVHGYYLYQVGMQIHPLAELEAGTTTWNVAHIPLMVAEGALEPLIARSIFQLRTSVQAGQALLTHVRAATTFIMEPENTEKYMQEMEWASVYNIKRTLTAFEAVLEAELALIPLFVVTPKSGMNLGDLIESGQICFPDDLVFKVPEALGDVQQATKCIAFELPTAAGFHLHRANESVLRAYFKTVAPKITPPRNRNMGEYLKKLAENKLGEPKVIAALTQLKDLHRNPLFHPEETLGTPDEAISLLGAVRSAMSEMLKAIPAASVVGGVNSALAAPSS